MAQHIEIILAGARRELVFNNYAFVEIGRALKLEIDTTRELTRKIDELIQQENHMLLLKILVYAGHCGDCYRRQNVTDLTSEEVGNFIGEADEEELYGVWESFIAASGVTLNDDSDKTVKS